MEALTSIVFSYTDPPPHTHMRIAQIVYVRMYICVCVCTSKHAFLLFIGTSTDVSRYAGEYEHVFESTTAGVTIQAPQLDINTVAAGGGSRLFFRSGMFVVGPESSGAHPGPTCYGKGNECRHCRKAPQWKSHDSHVTSTVLSFYHV